MYSHLETVILVSVEIPANVITMGYYAFGSCSSLANVTISEGVTNIGRCAFINCSSLECITIPASVTDIGEGAFRSCSSMTNINVHASNLKYCDVDGVLFNKNKTVLIVYPNGRTGDYTIPTGVLTIGEDAFESCSGLTGVEIPTSVTSISKGAFYTSGLKSVSIPSNVTSIGEFAFGHCSGLKNVTISEGVMSIDELGFAYSSLLKSVSIPSTMRSIGNNAFSGCTKLSNGDVYFGGTANEWNTLRLSIGNGNEPLLNATFHPNSTGPDEDANPTITFNIVPANTNVILTFGNQSLVTASGNIYRFSSGTVIRINPSSTDYDTVSLTSASGRGVSGNQYTVSNADDTVTITLSKSGTENYGYIINTGDKPWKISLNASFEDIVHLTPSTEYNPALSYGLAGLSRAVYSESDIQKSLVSLGFDYDHSERMFLDDPEHYCSGYVVAKKMFRENGEDKTLVLIVIRGSVGYNWNNLLNLGDSWTGSGQYPALKDDADIVHNALKALFNGNIPNDSNTIYVITGHSQGAGAANILGTLMWYDEVPTSNVYDYTFACPNVACFPNDSLWNPGGRYNYIYNIGNADDIVSFLPNNWFLSLINPLVDGHSSWWKYGRSSWFIPEDSNHPGLTEAGIGHDMIYYVRHMSNLYPGSSFATSDEIIEHVSSAWWRVLVGLCPVDMTIYDKDGNPIAAVVNNQTEYYDSNFGQVMIFVEGDQKYFFLPPNQDYDVRITATADGEMTYKVLDFNVVSGDSASEKDFTSIPLTLGKTMTSPVSGNTSASDVKLFVVDENDNPISEVNEDGTETPIFTIHNSPYTKGSGHSIYIEPIQQSSFDFFELSLSLEGDNPIQVETYHLGFQVNIISGQSSPSKYYMHLSDSFLDTLPAGTYYLWGIKDNQNTLIGSFIVNVADDVIATVNGVECRTVEEVNVAIHDADNPVITVIAGRTIPYEPYSGNVNITGGIPWRQTGCVVISKDSTLDLNGGTLCGLVINGTNLLVEDGANGGGQVTGVFDFKNVSDIHYVGTTLVNDGIKAASLRVTGGSFVPAFNVSQYLAPGYMVESVDGWDKVVPVTYTVSYDANGGGGTPESQSKTHGEALTLADAVPSRTGWYFIGWAESPNAVDPDYPRPGGTFTRDADTVLYAVWAQPDLVLPSAITEIGEEAFAGGAFRFAELPKHAVSIGSRAFADCSNLKYIFIHDKVTEIASDAFGNIKGITIFGGAPYQGVKTVAETYAEAHGFTFIPVYWRVPIYVPPQTPIIVE